MQTHIFLVGENTVIFIQNGPSQVNEQIQVRRRGRRREEAVHEHACLTCHVSWRWLA